MQRMLVTVVVIALVLASLAAGAMAAHWPFWQRAWQWQAAGAQWPDAMPGPRQVLNASPRPLQLTLSTDSRLAPRAGDDSAALVLVGDVRGWAAYWSAPNVDVQSPIDGRGLVRALLAPLLGAMQQQSAALQLDQPLRMHIDEWRGEPRGEITARQLLWEMSGLVDDEFRPFNPLSPRAQMASGPDFNRAALQAQLAWPPGSHFEPALANAQLLSLLAGRVDGGGFAHALQRHLWGRLAAHEATGMLDHRRGNLSATCCLEAAPLDWLRVGLLLAGSGAIDGQRILPEGYVPQMTLASPVHPAYGLGFQLGEARGNAVLAIASTGRRLSVAPGTGRAVLWVGEGVPPAWLDELLLPRIFGAPDNGKGG
jgi:hypothetical protein